MAFSSGLGRQLHDELSLIHAFTDRAISPDGRPSAAKHQSPKSSFAGRLEAGAAVKELQQLLKSLGLYGKNADGKFGAMTSAALMAFQRQQGLKTDGWAGPKTLAKLRQLVAASHHPATLTAPAAALTSSTGGKLALGATGPEAARARGGGFG